MRDKQTDIQTDRQTDRAREREREKYRPTSGYTGTARMILPYEGERSVYSFIS